MITTEKEGKQLLFVIIACKKHLQADLPSHILVCYMDLQQYLHLLPPPALLNYYGTSTLEKKKVQFLEITLESNVDKKVSQREWKLTAVKFNETYCVPKAQAAKLNLKRCQAGKLVIGLATVLDEISRMTFLYHEIKTDGNSYAWDEKLQYLSSQLPVFLAPDLRLSGLKGNLPSPAQGWSQPLQVTERYTKGLFPDTVFIANGHGKGERAKQSP